MSVADTISRPYAKAIFQIALQNNNIEEWKNILILINKIASSKKISSFLSGALAPKDLSSVFITIIHDIISNNMIKKHAKNLIKLLAYNQRLNISNDILKKFLQLEANYKNILIIKLSTAFSLQEKYIIKIQKILENFFLKKTEVLLTVNPQILGGLIAQINDTVFDFSIQNYLKKLSEDLNF